MITVKSLQAIIISFHKSFLTSSFFLWRLPAVSEIIQSLLSLLHSSIIDIKATIDIMIKIVIKKNKNIIASIIFIPPNKTNKK